MEAAAGGWCVARIEGGQNAGEHFRSEPQGQCCESENDCFDRMRAGIGIVEARDGERQDVVEGEKASRGEGEDVALEYRVHGMGVMASDDEDQEESEPSDGEPLVG
jgi:hypothetical protein